jgi:dTDP-4-dehydrorhamnose reductase
MSSGTFVVLGASGLVGARACALWSADFELITPTHAELDVLDAPALDAFLEHTAAEHVVNLAAWADVDGAEPESGDLNGRVHRLNVDYPRRLARACRRLGKHLVHVSTDYVFDGTQAEAPYTEQASPHALCWYAETKLLGEAAVIDGDSNACIARIEMPYMAHEHAKRDLARTVATRLQLGQSLQGVSDQRITPVFLDDAATALRRLAETRYAGVVHVAAGDWTTPYTFASGVARRLGLSTQLILPATFENFAPTRPARRPQHSWLDVTRFTSIFGDGILRPVEEALDVWAAQYRAL